MAALVISISLNVSVESVGSSSPRVILIGSISIDVSVTPEVGAAAVSSPTGVLELNTHSSLEADPSESSSPFISVALMVLPFLCLYDSKSDTEILERHIPIAPILPAPSAIVAPSSEFSLAHVVASLEICRWRAILIRPGENIPIVRLYRTHPGGPCRKSVRPLHSHCLELRYTSHHLDHFTFGSSSSHSSSDHSSSEHFSSGHSLSGHTPPDTTDADSSTPLRFVHIPLARTPWCNKAYLHWKSALLSTMYPPTTSKSSAGDSSSESSARPSRKRCRSLVATLTSFIYNTRALVPSRADLFLPLDRDVEARVDTCIDIEIDVGVDVEDEVESSDRGTMEVGVDMVARIDIPDGMLMPNAVERSEQRARANSFWRRMRFMESELRQIRRFRYYDRMRFRILETFAVGRLEHDYHSICKGDNVNGGNGGNGNPNENNSDARPVTRECTYQDFMKCQPLNFKGTEGIIRLIRWFKKMETMFHISNCPDKYQVKYATRTLLNSALTWWNSHKRTVKTYALFAMTWRELVKLMVEVYCLRNEIQKIEFELWNLTMVPEEEDQVERYIGDLSDIIQGDAITAEPTRLQDVIRIANNLMDQKLKGYAVKNAKNKKRLEVNQRDNHG
nr:hypothetical protein [Tanacetum cinerariifolium]